MNILLTGATGFIGKRLLKRLMLDHSVFLLVRETSKVERSNVAGIFVFSDNINELSSFLIENNIDGVIHLASLFLAQHQPENIKELVLSNIYLGTALLEAVKKSEVKWFLNTGTYWQHYIPDSNEYCPVNLYAATKQAFIDMARYYTETSPLRFSTLKICDTYGEGDTRRKILNLFKEHANSKDVLEMSKGEQYIDILHIDDVVEGFVLLIGMLSTDEKLQSEYLLSSQDNITLKELAEIYQNVSGEKIAIRWGGKPYREREVMLPWQAGTMLPGWEKKVNLEKGIKLFITGNHGE